MVLLRENFTTIALTVYDVVTNKTLVSYNYHTMNSHEQDQIYNITREYPLSYASVMFGYLMPIVLIITVITNSLIVAVLAQKHMRTPTNIVLFSMAIVDLLTLLSPSPWYFYIYTLGFHDRFLHPPSACYAHHIMTDVVPVFFHTSSIWLALLLAGQRYIYVCHPTLATTWCTISRVKRAIILILFIAFLHQLPRLFDNTFTSMYIEYEGSFQYACKNTISDWVDLVDVNFYFSTYFTFRILFVFVVPDIALIILNCLLFRALRKAKNKRFALISKESSNLMMANNRGANSNVRQQQRQLQKQKQASNSSRQIGCEIASATPSSVSNCQIAETSLAAIDEQQNKQQQLLQSGIKGVSRGKRLSINYLFDKNRHFFARKDGATNRGENSVANANVSDPGPNVSSSTSNNMLNSSLSSSATIQPSRQQLNSSNSSVTGTTNTTTSMLPVTSGSNNPIGSSANSQQLMQPKPSTSFGGSGNVTVTSSIRNLDSNKTTLMLIVVVTVFLTVEIPQAVVTVLHVILNTFEIFKDVEYKQGDYIKLFTNFIIMISYSLNFTIYCSMSKKFRETFKDLFLYGRGRGKKRRSRKRCQSQAQHHQNQCQTRDFETTTGPSGRGRSIPMIIFI